MLISCVMKVSYLFSVLVLSTHSSSENPLVESKEEQELASDIETDLNEVYLLYFEIVMLLKNLFSFNHVSVA